MHFIYSRTLRDQSIYGETTLSLLDVTVAEHTRVGSFAYNFEDLEASNIMDEADTNENASPNSSTLSRIYGSENDEFFESQSVKSEIEEEDMSDIERRIVVNAPKGKVSYFLYVLEECLLNFHFSIIHLPAAWYCHR